MKLLFKIILLSCASFLCTLISCAQEVHFNKAELNLDFENSKNNVPIGWQQFSSGDYKITIDSVHYKKGKYSAVIESSDENSGFQALYISLPDNYLGKEIKLRGWIKTENVHDGFAGLWVRIDPEVGFDNMNKKQLKGTTNWQQYEIILPLAPKKTTGIIIGGLLIGKGKMWIDDLEVFIDGKDITKESIDIYKSDIPADNDKEFDNGSKINANQLSNEQISNLELLGRVWGFMKYHHPAIAKGEYNWDYELFRFLPEYIKVTDKESRDALLLKWIQKYGNIPTNNKPYRVSETIFIKNDLTWIDNKSLSKDLKEILYHIYNNRNQGSNYYISLGPGVGNPDFKNEKLYENMPYPDAGFRLLALYKFWNMIEYFFPYKYLTDKKWDTVMKEYIPVFVEAKDELAYELATTRLIGEINDSHAYIMRGDDKIQLHRGFNYAPYQLRFIENKLGITDIINENLAKKNKLKIGDFITHIDGKSIEALFDSISPFYGASNFVGTQRPFARDILRSSSENLNLRVISGNNSQENKIQLYNPNEMDFDKFYKHKKNVPVFKIIKDSIGYFSLMNVTQDDVRLLKDTLSSLQSIIIDIRNYPNQFVALTLPSLFINNKINFVKFSVPNINTPGEFSLNQGSFIEPSGYRFNEKNQPSFKGKVIVLIDETSQSQAEFTAMALRATPNCILVGSNSSGADGNFSSINLPGGIKTGISGIGVYYPDGRETQRIGLVPDVIVKPTIKGISEGRDEVLEKAIDLLKN